MSYVADLHLHSAYAYATSKDLTLENLAVWANLKGIDLLATADFTHPAWFQELRQRLTPASRGLYRFGGVHFVLGTEISCVYPQAGRGRRVHLLLLAPDFDTVAALNSRLAVYGNLSTDGRPTLNLSVRDLTALALGTNPECMVIPAHVWTPWYGMYGSKSGFDNLDECFQDMAPHIYAVETGLSSDPQMNWAIQELFNRTIVSFSDAHSLPKLAREVTVFRGPLTYPGLAQALAESQVEYTVEFYPAEGKYHYNGHRKCGVCQSPEETHRMGSRCPACGKALTLGVLHRTNSLSNHAGDDVTQDANGFIHSAGRPPFIRLIPLQEIISEVVGKGVTTKAVQSRYRQLVQEFGNELQVLIRAASGDLSVVAGEDVARGIMQSRLGEVGVEPGYDGVFGKVSLPQTDAIQGKQASVGRQISLTEL